MSCVDRNCPNQEKAEKWDEFEERNKPGLSIFPTTLDYQFIIDKYEEENKRLKESVGKIIELIKSRIIMEDGNRVGTSFITVSELEEILATNAEKSS